MLVEGIRLRGENAGEVTLVAHPLGSMSGDTEAEYVLPATSPRTSGDDGEGGAGGMRWGAAMWLSPAVLRSCIHCSR